MRDASTNAEVGSDTSTVADLALLDGDARQRVPDTAPPPCRWGPFSTPTLVHNVNSTTDDWAPSISSDGRTLYFYSFRGGDSDIYRAHWSDATSSFGAPAAVVEVNSSALESDAHISADDRTLVFSSTRAGGLGEDDLWIATRPGTSSPFANLRALQELNSPQAEGGSWLSADNLRLYFNSARTSPTTVLYWASRSVTSVAFSGPVPLTGLASPANDRRPTLSADELEIIFASQRRGGAGGYDLWAARREHRDAPFGAPRNLTEINTPKDDSFPSLSTDGTTLYANFAAVTSGDNDAEIWVTTRSCGP